MGVEFRLSRQDGHKVEDFLARKPVGVSGIVLDTTYSRYQADAADAARAADVEVLFDPATERMADPGFAPEGLGYFDGTPFDLAKLNTNAEIRSRLVESLIESHPNGTTVVTPPHFHVHDPRSADLNIALAEETLRLADKPVRASLVINRKFLSSAAEQLVKGYYDAGIRAVEVRVTPLGGDNESVAKIRDVFRAIDTFTAVGIEVVLGYSGNIGQTAVALGHASHYSVGIGLREQVNHAAAITRQKAPPRDAAEGQEGGGRFGPIAGIYLPGPAITLGRKAGKALLDNTDIRTRVGCRIGSCRASVSGPAVDPREHYLHARAAEMESLLTKPAAWRPTAEADRLRRAVELRKLINENYLSPAVAKLNIRTLQSLIDDIGEEQAMTA